MGAVVVTQKQEEITTVNSIPHTRPRTHSSTTFYSSTQLSTVRLIFKSESALQAYLSFLCEKKKCKYKKNFLLGFLFLESFDPNTLKFGKHCNSFHNFSSHSGMIQDDPIKSQEFLRQLGVWEQYLMVVSVICGLNDFMRSDWHALWQQIEMQCTEPPPHTFPAVCDRISEKFSLYDSELQFFLKTVNMTTVFDLLVACLNHLPFPLAVMEMSAGSRWFPISHVNPAFVSLTGYGEDELKGMTIETFCRDLDPALLTRMRTEILQSDGSRAILPLRRSDGSLLTCAVGLIPIFDVNRSVICFLGLFDDITSSDYCLTRLKVLSDLLDSISPDLNIFPPNVGDGCHSSFFEEDDQTQSGYLI
jgi:PAS domain S-box-containing protein